MQRNRLSCPFSWHYDAFYDPNHRLLRLSMFLSTFFVPISTEGWKCDLFFARHTGHIEVGWCFSWHVSHALLAFTSRTGQHLESAFAKHFASVARVMIHPLANCFANADSELEFKGNGSSWQYSHHTLLGGCESGPLKWAWNRAILLNNSKFTPPKRRFWKVEPTFQNAFSKHFSRVWVLDLG